LRRRRSLALRRDADDGAKREDDGESFHSDHGRPQGLHYFYVFYVAIRRW
jgi:hypothetical protein